MKRWARSPKGVASVGTSKTSSAGVALVGGHLIRTEAQGGSTPLTSSILVAPSSAVY